MPDFIVKRWWCKHCWIEVGKIPKADRVVGKGVLGDYRHLTVKTPEGLPSCGRASLNEEDVVNYNPNE